MKLTKRKKIYAAMAAIVVIVIANIINRPKPYTGIWGLDGGVEYEMAVKKLQEKDFYITQKTANKIVGTNTNGISTGWNGGDRWVKAECDFTQGGKLKRLTLTKWSKPEYAPSLIKDLEKIFGKKKDAGAGVYFFGDMARTYSMLSVSDNLTYITISYDITE